jgi:hypothetical protein
MTDAASWITAGATAGAAFGTVGALVFAARAATSASESATIAAQGLQAEARPQLLDVPYEHYANGAHEYPWGFGVRQTTQRGLIEVDARFGTFAVPVRNVGRGTCLVEAVSMTLTETGDSYSEYSGVAIPVGEDRWLAGTPIVGDIRNALARVPAPILGLMPYIFTITYTDIAYQHKQRLELGVDAVARDPALRVIRIRHVDLTPRPKQPDPRSWPAVDGLF